MAEREAGPAAIVREYLAALNRASIEDAVRCVSDEFVNEHTATLGESVVGRDAYRTRLVAFMAQFPGLQYEVEHLIVDGRQIAVAYRMSARWRKAGAEGLPDRPFSIRGMFRFEIEHGRIVRRVDYWDSADFLRQVEAQPKR